MNLKNKKRITTKILQQRKNKLEKMSEEDKDMDHKFLKIIC